jgi:hypothetical protein
MTEPAPDCDKRPSTCPTPPSGTVACGHRVLCIGDITADVVASPMPRLPGPGEVVMVDRIAFFPGGNALNAAVALKPRLSGRCYRPGVRNADNSSTPTYLGMTGSAVLPNADCGDSAAVRVSRWSAPRRKRARDAVIIPLEGRAATPDCRCDREIEGTRSSGAAGARNAASETKVESARTSSEDDSSTTGCSLRGSICHSRSRGSPGRSIGSLGAEFPQGFNGDSGRNARRIRSFVLFTKSSRGAVGSRESGQYTA